MLFTIVIMLITITSFSQEQGTFTDPRDGKVYKTVVIGSQTWMAQNLAFKAESGCWAYNNDEANVSTYGYLYNYETAKKVCPTGWHLSGETDWGTLDGFLRYHTTESVAGGMMKETGILQDGTGHWYSPNTGAANSSGFSALPGGFRHFNGFFFSLTKNANFWLSTSYVGNGSIYGFSMAKFLLMSFDNQETGQYEFNTEAGFSVRCVKD